MVRKSEVLEFTSSLFSQLELRLGDADEYQLELASFKIRLFVFDPHKKVNLLPFWHLIQLTKPDDDYEFTVYIADRSYREGSLPAKCWSAADVQADSSIAGFAENGVYTSLEADFGNFFLVDHTSRKAVKIFSLEKDALPDWEYFYPLRKIINQFTIGTSYVLLHAGALARADADNGMLLTGRGQSGKSTICALSACAQINFAGDDFLLVDTATGNGYCLYSSLKVRAHLKDEFHDHAIFKEYPVEAGSDKSAYYVPKERGHFLKKQFKINAVIKPVYRPELPKPIFEPLSRSQMMRHLALSTMSIMRGGTNSDQECFRKMGDLIRTVPCLTFNYNSNAEQVKNAVADYLDAS
jgi:hypothetical protein